MKEFNIRAFQQADTAALVALGITADMGTLSGFETTLVAHDPRGDILGFCRVRIFDGQAYVNPIVVEEKSRRLGIGTALLEECRAKWGPLRFIARGNALPFYEALNCTRLSWSEIAPEVFSDCTICEQYEQCKPQPMEFTTTRA